MSSNDPITLAAMAAIDTLMAELADARAYLGAGETLAAIGTLVSFDDRAEDVRAALRLLRMARARLP